jgi:DNA repair ATPase RecN
MLKEEIVDNIQEIKNQLDAANDGIAATKKVAELIIANVQEHFQKFGATQSVDERIQILADSSQNCVKIVEDFHNNLEKEVLDFRLQVSTLENLLDRLNKFEEIAGEQNVSIEDEGEKKGDDSELL